MHKKEMLDSYVSVEHLLLAFYSDVRFGQEFFKNLKLDKKALKDVVKDVRGSQRVTDQSKYLCCLCFEYRKYIHPVDIDK